MMFVVSCLALAGSVHARKRQCCHLRTRRREARAPVNCNGLALSNASCPTRTASSAAPTSPTMVLHFTQRVTASVSVSGSSAMTRCRPVSDTCRVRENRLLAHRPCTGYGQMPPHFFAHQRADRGSAGSAQVHALH